MVDEEYGRICAARVVSDRREEPCGRSLLLILRLCGRRVEMRSWRSARVELEGIGRHSVDGRPRPGNVERRMLMVDGWDAMVPVELSGVCLDDVDLSSDSVMVIASYQPNNRWSQSVQNPECAQDLYNAGEGSGREEKRLGSIDSQKVDWSVHGLSGLGKYKIRRTFPYRTNSTYGPRQTH